MGSRFLCRSFAISLLFVNYPPAFSALWDVGTYRLGASVARTPPTAKSKYNRPKTHGFLLPAFFGASSSMETSVYVMSIRTFWKRRTHLPVRPYIAIILPRSWRLRASFPGALRRILSLHSVYRVQPFFALPDVGTYRLGASVARTPPAAK